MINQNVFRDFSKYVSLNILGQMAYSCYTLADTFFVSAKLGADGLTALNLAFPVFCLINGTGLMLGIGGGTRYSICKSRNENRQANRTFTNSVYLAVIFAILFVFTGLFFSETVAKLLGADSTVLEMTNTYLKVMMLFAPAFITNNLLQCFVRNDGNPSLATAAMISGSLSNVVVLVKSAPCKKVFGGILSSGISAFLTEAASGVVMFLFNFIILHISGNVGVAAFGVITVISLVVVAMYTGLSQGIQPIISQSYGSGRSEDVRTILNYAMITMLILSGAIYSIIFFHAASLTAVFNSRKNVTLADLAVKGLKLYFTACPFIGLNIVLATYFISTQQPRFAQIISMLRGFMILIPMAFLMSSIWEMSGVWCAYPMTELLVAAVTGVLYKYNKIIQIKK